VNPSPSSAPRGMDTTRYATTQIVQSMTAAPIRRRNSTGLATQTPPRVRTVAVTQHPVPGRFWEGPQIGAVPQKRRHLLGRVLQTSSRRCRPCRRRPFAPGSKREAERGHHGSAKAEPDFDRTEADDGVRTRDPQLGKPVERRMATREPRNYAKSARWKRVETAGRG